jgi:hypothetical protein
MKIGQIAKRIDVDQQTRGRLGRVAFAAGPLMEWSGRAPAPPAIEAAWGAKGREHAMSQKIDNSRSRANEPLPFALRQLTVAN